MKREPPPCMLLRRQFISGGTVNRNAIAMVHACAVVAAALSMLSSSTVVDAQQPTQAQGAAIKQSCRSDFQAHCAGVPTGGQRALDCLKQNASVSSAACQKALAAVGGAGASPSLSGGAPASASSSGATAPAASAPVASGGAMPPREEMRVRNACAADYRAHCAGVQPGEGRAIACLKSNAATLSPGCQKALMAAKQ